MKRLANGGSALCLLLLALFLVSPPAVRLAIHCGWLPEAGKEPLPGRAEAEEQAELIALLQNRLQEVNRDLQLISSAGGLLYDPSGGPGSRNAARYRIAVADVLPLSTPSAGERTLCVSLYGIPVLQKNSAVLSGDHLVGRLVDESTGSGIGRIQSILDPLFRVRFRCGEDAGMLWGTGRTDGDGHPLLEVHHLGKPPAFRAGDSVLTEGGDGRYPPGCLAGRIHLMPGQKESRAIVRSGIRLDSLRQVTLLEDLTRKDLAILGEKDR
ncbi:MAG: hypothetical protein MK138_00660 [Planctomycetes bacterium]|nr:hypothetical protein [Planctomycetota bacterium]